MNKDSNQTDYENGNIFPKTGWLPPLPDHRDYTIDNPDIIELGNKLGSTKEIEAVIEELRKGTPYHNIKQLPIPSNVDLHEHCSPIEDQRGLGSCTAQAAAGVIEYFERKAFGKHVDASRLFIYKTTRNLMGATGDTGAWLRTTMAAMKYCGTPPEKYWPYTDRNPEFDREPSSFIYALADNYEALTYFCHDPIGENKLPGLVLFTVKLYLARQIPSMFGFYGFDNGSPPYRSGDIVYPCPGDRAIWGHAVVAVGYDDNKKIKNRRCNLETTGALLIRNSWGRSWGENGYGWLPYEFILKGLALDFWSLLSMNWVKSDHFGLNI